MPCPCSQRKKAHPKTTPTYYRPANNPVVRKVGATVVTPAQPAQAPAPKQSASTVLASMAQPAHPPTITPKPAAAPASLPADFNWEAYLINNPEVIPRTKETAERHWLTKGAREGRSYEKKREFNWQNYINRYPDLPAHGIKTQQTALNHFIIFGIKEGRNAA